MSVLDMIRGRATATRLLTNKSGGAVAVGDVVVIGDGTNDDAFTTTTTDDFNARMVGVALEAIANDAAGLIAIQGYVSQVNTTASVTRDHFLFCSTTVKQADGSATRAAGAFGQILETGSNPPAIIWGMPDGAAGSGAPTGAQYIVGAADATLSAEKVKAALYANYDPDEYPSSGLTLSDEFDDSSLDGAWSWDTAPSATVSESAFPGFLHIDGGTDATPNTRHLTRSFTPGAAAFTVVAKVSINAFDANHTIALGIVVRTTAPATLWNVNLVGYSAATPVSSGHRIITTAATRTATTMLDRGWFYLMLQRDSSTNYKGYISTNGITWSYIGGSSVAGTVGLVGFLLQTDTDNTEPQHVIDFIRVFNSQTKTIGA